MDYDSDLESINTQESINTHEVTSIANDYLIKLNKEYDKTVAEQKTFNKIPPSQIRMNNYDTNYRILENNEENINEQKESLDFAIQYLEEGKNKLNEIINIIQNMKQVMNNAMSEATLQALSREAISKYKIKPNPNDTMANSILEQPYNEIKNKGGRKIITNKKKKYYKKRRITNKKKH